MIPKTIHYCWFGNPCPEEIMSFIGSWHKYMPDYEFRLWNEETFDIHSIKWVKQAVEEKKYAFAADYIRLYALYNYGGIYLDTDVLVYKSFDDLLSLPYFIGQDFLGAFETGIIGAHSSTPWIKRVMDYYENTDFINSDGSLNIRNNPVIFFDCLFPHYKFIRITSPKDFKEGNKYINLFPAKFFNGRNNIEPEKYPESYSSHFYAASWTGNPGIKFPKGGFYSYFLNFIYGLNYHLLRKRVVHNYDPIFRQKH